MIETFGSLINFFGIFVGVSLVIWTSTQARIARIRAERGLPGKDGWLPTKNVVNPQDSAIVAQIKALQQQIAEMQSTSHQFDISFDEALNRMESRVSRLETKSAFSATQTTEESTALRNGQ